MRARWLLDSRDVAPVSSPALDANLTQEQTATMSRVNITTLVALITLACSSAPDDTAPEATGGTATATGGAGATGGNQSAGGAAPIAAGGSASTDAGCDPSQVYCGTYDCALVLCGTRHGDWCLTARDDDGTLRGAAQCYTSHVQDYWLTCCTATCGDGGTETQCGRVRG